MASFRCRGAGLGAVETDALPPLPRDASDSPAELQLDPLVIEPLPTAVAPLTAMPIVASEASSASESAPDESSPTILTSAAELMIVESTNSLATDLPQAAAAPFAAVGDTIAETVAVKDVEALEEKRPAPAEAAAAATTALSPDQQSEIGAAVEYEPGALRPGDVGRSDAAAALPPEAGSATAADRRHVVLGDGASEIVAPAPPRSEQSIAVSDPPAAKASIASENETKRAAEEPTEQIAASSAAAIDAVHIADDPAITVTARSAEALSAPAEALSQAGPSLASQSIANEMTILAAIPFAQQGFANEPTTSIAGEANRDAPIAAETAAPAASAAEPLPTGLSTADDIPHEDLLAGAWERAVSQPPSEPATTLPAQQERVSPGQTFDVLLESETRHLARIARGGTGRIGGAGARSDPGDRTGAVSPRPDR
jgi:hypothetical protein